MPWGSNLLLVWRYAATIPLREPGSGTFASSLALAFAMHRQTRGKITINIVCINGTTNTNTYKALHTHADVFIALRTHTFIKQLC